MLSGRGLTESRKNFITYYIHLCPYALVIVSHVNIVSYQEMSKNGAFSIHSQSLGLAITFFFFFKAV